MPLVPRDAADRAKLDEELATTLWTARVLGVPDPEETGKVKDLREQIADARADAEAESDVYGHLANFFARYYAEGDFMSQRRYSGGGGPAYLIPYDGEEVKLHWANADQYYVKTTENYASYVFSAGDGGRRVRFEIASADNEKDNVKEAAGKQRRFVLAWGQLETAIEVACRDAYGKCLQFDYPYRRFHEDGYGKDYDISNLPAGIQDENSGLYLLGCLQFLLDPNRLGTASEPLRLMLRRGGYRTVAWPGRPTASSTEEPMQSAKPVVPLWPTRPQLQPPP